MAPSLELSLHRFRDRLPKTWPATTFFWGTTLFVFLKLMISYETMGYRLGQVSPWGFLHSLWTALSTWTAQPAYDGHYLVNLGSALLLTGWTLALRPKAQRRALVALNVLFSFFVFADTVYFRFFHDFLSPALLLQLELAGRVSGAITKLLRGGDLFFFLDLIVLAVLAVRRRRARTGTQAPVSPPRVALPRRLGRMASALAVGAVAVALPLRFHMATDHANFRNEWTTPGLFQSTGLIPLHGLRFVEWVRDYVFTRGPTPEQLAQVDSWFDRHAHYASEQTPLFGVAKGQNVIVVQLEAFQNILVGQKLHGQAITPNLDALATHSLYFPNYYQQTKDGRTSDAEFTSNCSLLHLKSGSVYTRFPYNHFDCASGKVKALGYDSLVFHGNDKSLYNRYRVYPQLGYDRFFSLYDFPHQARLGMGVADREFFIHATSVLAERTRPFYAMLISLTSHFPFDLQGAVPAVFSPEVKSKMLGNYLDDQHYTDAAVGTFVGVLKRSGLWDRSVVIFYGDHDSGFKADEYAPVLGRALTPYERSTTQFRVGLWVHLPHDALAGVYPQPVGQEDLAPTVMHLLGQPAEPRWMGVDLLSPDHPLLPLRDGSFVDQSVFSDVTSEDGHRGCYDLATQAPLPDARCEEGERQAFETLDVSRTMIVNDLPERPSRPAAPPAAPVPAAVQVSAAPAVP